MLKVFAATDVGRRRPHNEDSFLIGPRDCFVVADGMGGHAAGEVASSLLVDTVKRELPRAEVIMDQLGLEYVVKEANRAILQKIKDNIELTGMGTTVVLLHLGNRRAVWAHVGDSRLYRLRQGNFVQLRDRKSVV